MGELKKSFGFGTLALGTQYRVFAKLLAADLLKYHPNEKLYVLTDYPSSFSDYPNVVAVHHRFGGVRSCYHDKQWVVKKVLGHCHACIFLDADCRILEKINFEEIENKKSLVVSIFSESLQEKINIEENELIHNTWLNNPKRRRLLLQKLSSKLQVGFDDVRFIQESFFCINSKYGNTQLFLDYWFLSFKYLTKHLMEFGEGASIGIATLASGGSVTSLNYIPRWFFKDLYTNNTWRTENDITTYSCLLTLRRSIEKDCKSKNIKIFEIIKYVLRYLKLVFI